MKIEGEVRIPSGCAISAVISRDGKRMSGEMITNSMKPMHDRSNGLGADLPVMVFILNIKIFMRCTCFLIPAIPASSVKPS